MDRKTIIILVVCLGLLVAGNALIEHIFPPIRVPVSTNQVATATSPSPTNTAASVPAPDQSQPGARFVVRPEIPEETLVITNSVARYTFTSRGGGLKTVELLKYPQTVSALNRKVKGTNEVAMLNSPFVPPALALVGSEAMQDDGVYKLTALTNGARAEKTLTNGLTVTKEFRITSESNYVLGATVRFQNATGKAMDVPPFELAAGASTPMGPTDNNMAQAAQAVIWHNGTNAHTVNLFYFNTNTSTLGVFPRTVQKSYVAGSLDVQWVSAQNQFFALVTMAESNTPGAFVSVHMFALPPPSPEEIASAPHITPHPQALEATLGYAMPTLPAGGQSELKFNLYAGPKEYRRLSRLSDQLNNRLELVMDFGSFLGMSWFVPISKGLLLMMNWLHNVLGFGYGWIVVVLTVMLRLIFWPLTRASTRSDETNAGAAAATEGAAGEIQGRPGEVSAEDNGSFTRRTK